MDNIEIIINLKASSSLLKCLELKKLKAFDKFDFKVNLV